MVYDQWARVTRWVEGKFDDTGGSRNDSIATEAVGKIVAKEVVPGVEGKVP